MTALSHQEQRLAIERARIVDKWQEVTRPDPKASQVQPPRNSKTLKDDPEWSTKDIDQNDIDLGDFTAAWILMRISDGKYEDWRQADIDEAKILESNEKHETWHATNGPSTVLTNIKSDQDCQVNEGNSRVRKIIKDGFQVKEIARAEEAAKEAKRKLSEIGLVMKTLLNTADENRELDKSDARNEFQARDIARADEAAREANQTTSEVDLVTKGPSNATDGMAARVANRTISEVDLVTKRPSNATNGKAARAANRTISEANLVTRRPSNATDGEAAREANRETSGIGLVMGESNTTDVEAARKANQKMIEIAEVMKELLETSHMDWKFDNSDFMMSDRVGVEENWEREESSYKDSE